MDSENIIRLTKKRKKGFLRIIFSRFFLIFLLIVLQIVLIVMAYGWFARFDPYYSMMMTIFTVGMIIYLFNSSMDNSAKVTWMLIIAAMPIAGSALLWITRRGIGQRTVHARAMEMIEATMDVLPQPGGVRESLADDGSGMDDICTYVNRSGCFPILRNEGTEYYSSGEEMFSAMMEALEGAEKYIFIETFILREGYMWGRMLDVLIRKASQGVDVRIVFDGMNQMTNLPYRYDRLLREKGIKAKVFSPLIPFISSHLNYRDHRKILIVDGETAFCGGINLADEYINRETRFGHWKDSGLMVKGRAALSFMLMFLQMWDMDGTDELLPVLKTIDMSQVSEGETLPGYLMPYADCPLDDMKVGENVYMDILNRANRYVHIMSPYLIIDGEMEAALKFAALRGIDVRIILPGIPDKKIANALAKTYYRELTEAGVRIYEYTPGFIHSKVFVCDDIKAVVGTINLDYRSLYHHFECATYLYRTDSVSKAEEDFDSTLSVCREITSEDILKLPRWTRVIGALFKFIAPLM